MATGGATTDNAYIAGFTGADSKIPVPSAADQIATFLKTTDGPRKHDVFVQWIGANDILFDNTANPEKVAQLIKANIDLLREHGMSCPPRNAREEQQQGDANKLWGKTGARTVLLANYYDINTAPATYNSEYYSTANAKSFNAELTTQLKMLARRYSCSTFKVRFVDISEIFHSLETDPAKFGFDEKYLNPPTACLTGVYTSEGVPRNLCSDPEKHVFFDGYHVGKEVHALIGQKFEDAILAA